MACSGRTSCTRTTGRRRRWRSRGTWPAAKSVFTIHNLNYGADLIGRAMAASAACTTVSPTYAAEVHAPSGPHLHLLSAAHAPACFFHCGRYGLVGHHLYTCCHSYDVPCRYKHLLCGYMLDRPTEPMSMRKWKARCKEAFPAGDLPAHR